MRFMRRRSIQSALLLTAGALLCGADWLHFRGSDNRSATPESLPTALAKDESGNDRNVAWKVDLPGRGVSSPIVVGGKAIVTSTSGYNQDRLHVVAVDTKTGETAWERQFWATGRTLCHPTSSVAAPSPSSDGKRIYAFFSSNDLACLDLDGNLLWFRGLTHDYPTAANDVGMSASPLVMGDTVVVQVENKGTSFAAGLDAKTGETRWKLPRKADMNWTSPAVFRGKTRPDDLVLLQSSDRLSVHNPRTGEQVGSYEVSCSSISSPMAEDDKIYVPSNGLTALRYLPDAKSVELLWTANALAASNVSPVVYQGRVYIINGAGVLLTGDAATGEVLPAKVRLKGPYWATPVIAGDHLYAFNQAGLVQVVRLSGKTPEIVATGNFGDPIFGTPAVADGAFYVRTDGQLWKIAAP